MFLNSLHNLTKSVESRKILPSGPKYYRLYLGGYFYTTVVKTRSSRMFAMLLCSAHSTGETDGERRSSCIVTLCGPRKTCCSRRKNSGISTISYYYFPGVAGEWTRPGRGEDLRPFVFRGGSTGNVCRFGVFSSRKTAHHSNATNGGGTRQRPRDTDGRQRYTRRTTYRVC